jgi:RNA polymerase sigma-70 factor, ECF subfamily
MVNDATRCVIPLPSRTIPCVTDEQLLQAWRRGDRAAGDALIAKYYAGVLRFFELRTRFAEDLTQRTFLACVEGRERFRGEAGFRAYLFGIARRQLLRHIDDHARLESLASLSAPDPATTTSMSTLVARREEQHVLLRAIVDLPVDTQVLLGLYYWEGLQANEIAVVLEVPASTITTRLARARDELRNKIRRFGSRSATPEAIESTFDAWIRSLADHGAFRGKVPVMPRLAAALADRSKSGRR